MKIIELSYLEDVSEVTSILGSGYLQLNVNNGKAKIQSKGFQVKQTKKGNSLVITATSSGSNVSSSTNVSVTPSGTLSDQELEKEIAEIENEDW